MSLSTEEKLQPLYEVVINEEQQYSIWSAGMAVPMGWAKVGHCAPRESCLSYIDAHWTDMRPLSLRIQISEPTA